MSRWLADVNDLLKSSVGGSISLEAIQNLLDTAPRTTAGHPGVSKALSKLQNLYGNGQKWEAKALHALQIK